MKHRILTIVKWYTLSLFLFCFAIFVINFYYKNVGDTETAITDFPKIPLANQFGELKTVDDYKGKLVLVDFWFAACEPCLEEMKFYPELLKNMKIW